MNKPQITDEELIKIITPKFFGEELPKISLVGIRGYFKDSMGKKGENDFNLYDDAMLVIENGRIVGRYNSNTDPNSKSSLAQLKPGVYEFYRGKHKNRIDAFRTWPEGKLLPCWRFKSNGSKYDSTCQYVNIHDGGTTDTWSAGCQTLPGAKAASAYGDQFKTFRDQVYDLMLKYKINIIQYVLIDESERLKG